MQITVQRNLGKNSKPVSTNNTAEKMITRYFQKKILSQIVLATNFSGTLDLLGERIADDWPIHWKNSTRIARLLLKSSFKKTCEFQHHLQI